MNPMPDARVVLTHPDGTQEFSHTTVEAILAALARGDEAEATAWTPGPAPTPYYCGAGENVLHVARVANDLFEHAALLLMDLAMEIRAAPAAVRSSEPVRK